MSMGGLVGHFCNLETRERQDQIVKSLRTIRQSAGFTITELLIAALITVTVSTAGLQFYTNMHGLALSQMDISELQHLARSSIEEISRSFRMAGFLVPTGHPPYEISGDTLAIYWRNTQPVDTVLYFLEEFTSDEYALAPNLPTGQKLYKLMKRINSGPAVIYTDYVSAINYVPAGIKSLAVTVTIHAGRRDHAYTLNDGFRKYTFGKTMEMRNPS